jgi:hypothetical protein
MAITSRALGFAQRWFDAAAVQRIFEPLIADWQREWQDASPSRRARVSLRGLAAFICAVIVSSPQIARTSAPSSVTNRVASRIARFTFSATVLFIAPFLWSEPRWLDGVRILFLIPHALTLAFPFAMIAAVDTIRCDESLPPQVARAVVVKLGLLSVLLMVCFHGWVVPAANQAWRVDMAPAGVRAPARGVRELTTIELITDPSRAHAGETTNASGRAAVIRRELNNRAHLAILPVMLLWLRWGMLDRPRRRWYSPLPSWLVTPIMIAAFGALNFIGVNFARSVAASAAVGVWLPTLGFIAVGLIARWSRPQLIQQDC